MSEPENAENVVPIRPTRLYFTLTALEHAQIGPLVGYGNALMVAIKDRAPADVAAVAAEEAPDRAPTLPRALIARALEAAVMNQSELVMRALAYLGGLDPIEFGDRVRGVKLELDVVPPHVPCPKCSQSRIASNARCAVCQGQRMVKTVLRPEDRIHTEDEMKQREQRIVMPGGGE